MYVISDRRARTPVTDEYLQGVWDAMHGNPYRARGGDDERIQYQDGYNAILEGRALFEALRLTLTALPAGGPLMG